MKRAVRILPRIGLALVVLLGGIHLTAHLFTETSYYARVAAWLEADVDDHRRFPSRAVKAADVPFAFTRSLTEHEGLRHLEVRHEGRSTSLDTLLRDTGTTAFLVIQNDAILFERYLHDYDATSTQTSFSIAKSFVSALVGIAIAEGHIHAVDDPVTTYVPELLQSDPRFASITLEHLLTMSSGIRYTETKTPWGDDARTYYHPDLRALALGATIDAPANHAFHYNNYHPLLLGLVLERATGRTVSDFLEEKIWRPIGMEAAGSWSLDSTRSGFEKMESGINGRAIDFAKLGRLYLRRGDWDGVPVLPAEWVDASVRVDASRDPAPHYGYMWWTTERADGNHHFSARGNHGQFIHVAPENDLIIVRFGKRYGNHPWPSLFERINDLLGGTNTL